MSTNLEQRVFRLEGLVRAQQQLIAGLQTQVSQALQNAFAPTTTQGGGGGGGGAFFFFPTSAITGATGTWPTLSPNIVSYDVYQVTNTTIAVATAGATITNWFPATFVANKVCYCQPDNAGAYVVVDQSCT